MRQVLDCFLQIVWMEAERPSLTLVGDAAIAIDEVQAIGPACIGLLGSVVDVIDHGGELDAEFTDTASGDVFALLHGFRRGEQNVVADVALHLPDIGRVRF